MKKKVKQKKYTVPTVSRQQVKGVIHTKTASQPIFSSFLSVQIDFPPGGKFQVGDIARDIMTGDEGVLEPSGLDHYPLRLVDNTYTEVGRLTTANIIPRLSFVSRPESANAKKKVKKTFERWLNIYADGHHGNLYTTQRDADEYAKSTRIACVFVTGEYEVEE